MIKYKVLQSDNKQYICINVKILTVKNTIKINQTINKIWQFEPIYTAT